MAWPPEISQSHSPLYEKLRFFARRPVMYLGAHPLERFPGWLDGYRDGLEQAGAKDPLIAAMDRADMTAFFGKHLNLPVKYAGENAYKMVAYVSPGSGAAAFQDFLIIFDAFLKDAGFELPSTTISDEIHEWRRGDGPKA